MWLGIGDNPLGPNWLPKLMAWVQSRVDACAERDTGEPARTWVANDDGPECDHSDNPAEKAAREGYRSHSPASVTGPSPTR